MFIFEREIEHEWGGAERGRHRIRSRFQAPSCHHRAPRRARTHRPQDHDLTSCATQVPLNIHINKALKMALISFLTVLESLGALKSRSIKRRKRPFVLPGISSRIILRHFWKLQQTSKCHKDSIKAVLDLEGFFALSLYCRDRTTTLAFQQLFARFFPCNEFSNIAFVKTWLSLHLTCFCKKHLGLIPW